LRNGAFELRGNDSVFGWSLVRQGDTRATIAVESERPVHPNHPYFLHMDVRKLGDRESDSDSNSDDKPVSAAVGIGNIGYGGIPVVKGSNFVLSFWARSADRRDAILKVHLENSKGETLASREIVGMNPEWTRFTAILSPLRNDTNTMVAILAGGVGSMDLALISLMPEHLFKDRLNGMRSDLALSIADLKPAFFRFPGGASPDGALPEGCRWQDTLGERAGRVALWNRQLSPKVPVPDGYQLGGVGFFEYFQFCEDIGAEPVPVQIIMIELPG